MAHVRIAGFADEYSYHAGEHLQMAGKLGMPISTRFFSFSDEAKREKLLKL